MRRFLRGSLPSQEHQIACSVSGLTIRGKLCRPAAMRRDATGISQTLRAASLAAQVYRSGRARMMAIFLSGLFLLAITHSGLSAAQDQHSAKRERMVAEIAAMARKTGSATGRPRFSEAVMTVMGSVPRHRFVPPLQQAFAYENRALPIGEGQTISQPFLVALMTDLLDPKPGDTVLEVGTGSGYQAAVLAELVAKVYTIEIVEPLGRRAMQLLNELGYRNIEVRIGDGYNGWPEAAPFDSIVVTAAPAAIPKLLIDQLKPGGRLVTPAGGSPDSQYLLLVEKQPDGTTTTRRTLPVRFVPLKRDRANRD
jgi:protein-L-isoaspartate(D-aspartate) O-methyltransferase